MLVIVYLLAAAVFLALLISLGFKPRFITRLNGVILCFAAVAGVLLYGYGYRTLYPNLLQAMIRTVFSVFCMFLGRNEIGAISGVPFLARPGMQLLLYAVHLLALYCTASAVIAAIGAGLLRKLNLLLVHRGDIHLIYGASPEAVDFGEKLQRGGGVSVFVDTGGGSGQEERILRMGSLLFSSGEARKPDRAFLRQLGLRPGRQKLTLYCLDDDLEGDLRYAGAMARELEALGLGPEQTALTILAEDEEAGRELQAGPGRPGFGSVLAIEPHMLLSRLMLRLSPPWDTVAFDPKGRAKGDFHALIVGFGQTGQAVLRTLSMNAQFAGSRFHAVVMAKDYRQEAGRFFSRCAQLMEECDIRFMDGNAHGLEAYACLRDLGTDLNYVVLCTGSDKENRELAREYGTYMEELGSAAPVLICTGRRVERFGRFGNTAVETLFAPELLCGDRMDARAMLLNHRYHLAEGREAREDWALCDYFSRMSCRASADYLPAFLAASGDAGKEELPEGWPEDRELLENLSEMEHLRWNAFNAAMGYRRMPGEVFSARAEAYRREVEEKGSSGLRPGKDTEKRLHACLVPWEELPALSRREAELAGRNVDYQELDRDNVRMLPELLRAEREERGK